MDTNTGFTKINNNYPNWEWYTDTNTNHLYFHLLLMANFETKNWRGNVIERGQRITSVVNLATETGLTVSKVRTALHNLERTNYIETKPTNKYTLITIVNYDVHTYSDIQFSKQDNKQDNKQLATNKENKDNKIIKKENRESENKNLSHFDLLNYNSKNEVDALVKEYRPKIIDWNFCIKKFNNKRSKFETVVDLESWFNNWVKNNLTMNNNNSNTDNEQPKQKIGGF